MPSATACLPQPEEHLQRETLQFPALYPYHPRTQKRAGPQARPFNGMFSPCYFMRNFMGSRDSEGKNRSRNNTSTSTMRKGAMFRTRLPILMFPIPQTT